MNNDQTKQVNQIDEYPDFSRILRNFWKELRRLWAVVLVLTVLYGGITLFRRMRSYVPMYRAEAIFSVSGNYAASIDILDYNYYYDNSAAEQQSTLFPYVLRTDAMTERIKAKLGKDTINGTISAKSMTDTNLFVLSVTSRNAQDAYDILCAVIEVYPQVSHLIAGNSQLSICREPFVPTEPYNSFTWKTPLAKGLLTGFVLGMAVVLLISVTKKTVRSSKEVKKFLNLECLGKIQYIPAKKRSSQSGINISLHKNSSMTESFRSLRTKLLKLPGPSDGGKVLVFTSTLAGEGKSTLAANTALSLASGGYKTLLIDGDLRKQGLKKLLGITEPSVSLLELNSKQMEAGAKKILTYRNTGLGIMAGDDGSSNPIPFLKSRTFRMFVEQCRKHYDYIIIDTPPAGLIVDTAIISRYADSVIYVIREDYASRSQIYNSLQLLHENGANLAGFILNCTSMAESGKYGYNGYGYRYGYGYGYRKYGKSKYTESGTPAEE